MKKNYEIKRYGIGAIYLEEGWYNEKDIQDAVKQFELMKKRSDKLMEDMKKNIREV